MTIHKGQDVTAAIVAILDDEFLVGVGDKPAGSGWQGTPGVSVFVPYVVVFPVTGGFFEGTIGRPFEDARPDYIVHAYGASVFQCQFVNDRCFALLTSSTFVVAGRSVQLAIPDVEGGAVRDDDVTPPLFYAPTRWRIVTTSD